MSDANEVLAKLARDENVRLALMRLLEENVISGSKRESVDTGAGRVNVPHAPQFQPDPQVKRPS